MMHRYLMAAVVYGSCAVLPACGGGNSPTAPAVGGINVTFPAGGTIYIGMAPQLQAVETLSNGTTRSVTAAWSSDTPAVATVTATGIVAAVGAGEATIAADANGRRGTLRIRVYPNFNGTWQGIESSVSCDDTGAFEGVCGDDEVYRQGTAYRHDSRYTQSDAAVAATLDLGSGFTASGAATVSLTGELQLPSTRVRPEDADIKVDIDTLRFRSDAPARLTGTYGIRFTSPGIDGFVLLGMRLEDVSRTATTATTQRRSSRAQGAMETRIARMRQMVR